MDLIEVEAKTVEKAISIACEQLHTSKEHLRIEILQDAPNKIFSFMSGKKAKIRASLIQEERIKTPPRNTEGIENILRDTLGKIVKHISPSAMVTIDSDRDGVVLNIVGDGSGIFIGKKGQTLEALQYIMNKIKGKYCDDSFRLTVDSESYRARHTQSLVNLAKQLAIKAKKRNGPVTTNPMNSGDRRIIHLALKNEADLITWSKGEGVFKKVIIAPRQIVK